MLVQLAPHVNEFSTSSGGTYLSIKRGEKVQLEHSLAIRLLKDGTVVNATYPEIRNNEVVVVERDDDHRWRPVGKVTVRRDT